MLISDWSSDVCSSDLQVRKKAAPALITMVARTVAVVLVPPWLGALPTFVPGRLRHGGFGALDDLVELPAIEPHPAALRAERSEEHTSELQSLMRISYAVFCLKKKNKTIKLDQV